MATYGSAWNLVCLISEICSFLLAYHSGSARCSKYHVFFFRWSRSRKTGSFALLNANLVRRYAFLRCRASSGSLDLVELFATSRFFDNVESFARSKSLSSAEVLDGVDSSNFACSGDSSVSGTLFQAEEMDTVREVTAKDQTLEPKATCLMESLQTYMITNFMGVRCRRRKSKLTRCRVKQRMWMREFAAEGRPFRWHVCGRPRASNDMVPNVHRPFLVLYTSRNHGALSPDLDTDDLNSPRRQ